MAEALAQQGRIDEAQGELRLLLEERPDFEPARRLRAQLRELEAALAEQTQQRQQPPPVSVLERYPTVEAPSRVPPQAGFDVQVMLTEDRTTPEVEILGGEATPEGKLRLQLPASAPYWSLEVVLSAPRFDFLEGNNSGVLQLSRSGDSTPVRFRLRAPAEAGKGELYATFWHRGTYLARVRREIQVKDLAAAEISAAEPTAAVRATTVGAPSALDLTLQPPDLSVYLLEGESGGPGSLIVSSPHLQPSLHSFETPAGLEDWLRLEYSAFPQLAAEADPELRTSRSVPLLRGFGRRLYERFAPPAFKRAFWTLQESLGGSFHTIQIFSTDPTLPWELMRPVSPDGTREAEFLGISHQVARWHISRSDLQRDRPPQKLPLQRVAVVAPRYGDGQSLPAQQVEMKVLQLLPGFAPVGGDLAALRHLLESPQPGIVHFSGHGSVSSPRGLPEFHIQLEDVQLDLSTWRGLAPAGRRLNALVFFNACDIGRSQQIAGLVEGWAPAVLETGASGYIGGFWQLVDAAAADFAVHFYQQLTDELRKGPVNVAEVLRTTRGRFYQTGDPTYLAYAYYGDANFAFQPMR